MDGKSEGPIVNTDYRFWMGLYYSAQAKKGREIGEVKKDCAEILRKHENTVIHLEHERIRWCQEKSCEYSSNINRVIAERNKALVSLGEAHMLLMSYKKEVREIHKELCVLTKTVEKISSNLEAPKKGEAQK